LCITAHCRRRHRVLWINFLLSSNYTFWSSVSMCVSICVYPQWFWPWLGCLSRRDSHYLFSDSHASPSPSRSRYMCLALAAPALLHDPISLHRYLPLLEALLLEAPGFSPPNPHDDSPKVGQHVHWRLAPPPGTSFWKAVHAPPRGGNVGKVPSTSESTQMLAFL